ncbi:Fe-S cluster assembly protein IscX [Myxococcota bacterium]|nr:Fe-S cluster assembly protein IscX [Myxococcota bacterium]MBU1429173.1 Fe-S cluster assembly protein IscX [Myxococcota bacterium]MBU1896371.1 Fe-S cluster assembly protein IscX [Myxococcota bacterium]
MRWVDVHAIGEILYDRFPDTEPLSVRFTDLMRWVMEIPEFEDDPARCGEKILEGIQMAWYAEWRADNEEG